MVIGPYHDQDIKHIKHGYTHSHCTLTYQLCCTVFSSLDAQEERVFVRLILDFLPSFSSSLTEWALLNTGSKFLPNDVQRSLHIDERVL